jgi:hypothetical protein
MLHSQKYPTQVIIWRKELLWFILGYKRIHSNIVHNGFPVIKITTNKIHSFKHNS